MADTVAKVGPERALRNDRISQAVRLIHCCDAGDSRESILRSQAVKKVLQQYRHVPDMPFIARDVRS